MHVFLAALAFALAWWIYWNKEKIMAGIAEVAAAVDAARAEIEADKAAIIAEIQRLGLPDVDTADLVAKIAELGAVLDDVPGVTPPAPEPEPESV